MLRHTKINGFTLLEVLLVVAILGLVATLATLMLDDARAKSRDTKRIADITQINRAVELYYSNHGSYPDVPIDPDDMVSWSALLGILRADGLLLSKADQYEDLSRRNWFGYFLKPALASAPPPSGSVCPTYISPQDPLCKCHAPNQVLSEGGSPSYAYSVSNDLSSYRLRIQVERQSNPILDRGAGGSFKDDNDGGCDSGQSYYCIGNGTMVLNVEGG